MKIEKKPSIVLSFPTTTAAMAFEATAKEAELEGRLIPVPRHISTSCGLAFMSRKETEPELNQFLEDHPELEFQERYELML